MTKIRDTCLINVLKSKVDFFYLPANYFITISCTYLTFIGVLQECYAPQINTDFEYEKIVVGWLRCRVIRYNKSKPQKFIT